jgi:hypothetical protein
MLDFELNKGKNISPGRLVRSRYSI